jgi:hypothetical protein
MVVPDDRSGEVLHCTQCDRELTIPLVQTHPPPPVPPPTPGEAQPAIVVDTLVEARANLRIDHDRRMVQAIAWSLALLALLNAVPVAIAFLRPEEPGATHLERWALGIMLLGILQLCYAIYLLQVPDWSSTRVVSVVTLGIATAYAIAAGTRMLASPGNRVMEFLELDGNLFSSRQETLWCFAMVLLTGTLSYLAGRASTQWSRRARDKR